MNGDVNNDDRYSDYPRRLHRISGLPPNFISREIPPLRDVPHILDPRRERSVQLIEELERDRAERPLVLLDKQSAKLDERGEAGGLRLIEDEQEYRRRLRRCVVPPARAQPVLRPLRLPSSRDPRRALACQRVLGASSIGPPTLVENELLPPPEEETCAVLVIDLADWPHEIRSAVEIWPHECNVERARLDAQLLADEDEAGLMEADNADRDEIVECDENGREVCHYHSDVDTPMLGDDDDEVLEVLDEEEELEVGPRERRLSGGDMVIRVKDERLLMRPMPAEDDEHVDLVDLCSDDELDVKPIKLEPPPAEREGYRVDVVREVLEVVTLDDDDEDIIEITSASGPCVLDISSEAEEAARNERLLQSEISISQLSRRLDADSDRNAIPAPARDTEVDDSEEVSRAERETRDEASTESPSRPEARSPPRDSCRNEEEVHVDEWTYRSFSSVESVFNDSTSTPETPSRARNSSDISTSNEEVRGDSAWINRFTNPEATTSDLSELTTRPETPVPPINSNDTTSDEEAAVPEWPHHPPVVPVTSARCELVPAYVCDYGHRSASQLSPSKNRRGPQSPAACDDVEMREYAEERASAAADDSAATSVDLNAAAAARELAPPPPALTIPRATDDARAPIAARFALAAVRAASPSAAPRLELRFDGAGSTVAAGLLQRPWSEPGSWCNDAAWTGCERLRTRERRAVGQLTRRWRPYEEGPRGPRRRLQQLAELERALAMLRHFFVLAASWSSLSIFIGTHNLSLRCLLQAHANAMRSAEFWRARNDHWKNRNDSSIKDLPQIENYDSSDSNDQRSLYSYDGDEEEANDYDDQENQYNESYFSDSSSAASSIPKNFNSEPSSSLNVNFNIQHNLITSQVLKNNDSKFNRNSLKPYKKRHSLPAVTQQFNLAKRARSCSDASPKKGRNGSLKFTIKKDHRSQEYRISSCAQSIQLRKPKNSVQIVEINSNEDSTISNFTERPTFSENKSLDQTQSYSIASTSKLKVPINKTVPELELNDTRPVNMPVPRDNLENSLSTFLKSKLKRNLNDTVEVGRKRQKITDDPVAVNINVNITVNSLLKDSLPKQQPLELMSSNDNSKVLLPKTSSNICSTSDFSSCNESDYESHTYPILNSNKNTSQNSYSKELAPNKRNTDSVKSKRILQIDHNCNIENEISEANKISLENSENEVNISSKVALETKNQQNLLASGNLKLVFNTLFGEISDASETEEEILRKKRRKSRENRINQTLENNIVESVEKNQSKNGAAVLCTEKRDRSKLKNLNNVGSLKVTVVENIKVITNRTEINKDSELSDLGEETEISSVLNNAQTFNLSENQLLISNIETDKQNNLNKITLNRNIPTQIDAFQNNCVNKETNANTTDKNMKNPIDKRNSGDSNSSSTDRSVKKQVDVNDKSSKRKNSTDQIPKQNDQGEKSLVNKETDVNTRNKSSQKQIVKIENSNGNKSNSYSTDKSVSKHIHTNEKTSKRKSSLDESIPKKNYEESKSHINKKTNANSADKNVQNQIIKIEKIKNCNESNSCSTDKSILKHINAHDKGSKRKRSTDQSILKEMDECQKSPVNKKSNANFTDKNIQNEIAKIKNTNGEESNSNSPDKNIQKQIDESQKSPVNKETNVNVKVKSIEKQIDKIEKNGNERKSNSYSTNKNISKQIEEFHKSPDDRKINANNADKNIQIHLDKIEKNSNDKESNSCSTNKNIPEQTGVHDESSERQSSKDTRIPKQIDEFEKSHVSNEINANITDNILKQIDNIKNGNDKESHSYSRNNKNVLKQKDAHGKSSNRKSSTDQGIPKEIDNVIKETNLNVVDKNIEEQIDKIEKNGHGKELNSYSTNENISEQIDEEKGQFNKSTSVYIESNSYSGNKSISNRTYAHAENSKGKSSTNQSIAKQLLEEVKNCNSEKENFHDVDKSIEKQIDEFEKICDADNPTCYIPEKSNQKSNEFEKNCQETNSDQVMPDCLQSDDQVDLEGGDFEFISSIHKNKNDNEYSDDEYNNYSDFDMEYDGHNNVEYSSDIELIENHENPSINKDMQNVIDKKSHTANSVTKEISLQGNTHNLNKLPSFYNEDVKNYVDKDIINIDDEDIVILDTFGPVSKADDKKSNLNVERNIKLESIINLDSDEEADVVIEEISLEEENDELPNEEINCSKGPVERVSNINQTSESNDVNLETNKAIEKSELTEKNNLEFNLEETTNKEVESEILIDLEPNGAAAEVIPGENILSVSPDNEVRNTSEFILNSTQEITQEIQETSINTFIHRLIEDALNPSSSQNEKSTTQNITLQNILESNSETISTSTLTAEEPEDIFDMDVRSVSPSALVIDESIENNDSNLPDHVTEDNLNNCNDDDSVNEVTSSVDKLSSKHTVQFTGNVQNDINNPNILQEFNLAREIVAPEEIKNEPVIPDNNIEQQICENILEEFKRSTSNVKPLTSLKISVTEAPEVLINQSASNSVSSSIPSNIVIEVTVENPEKVADERNDWMDIDDLSKKEIKTTGTFKCRDINELLEKPVNKKSDANVVEVSNEKVQTTHAPEIPSTTNSTNSTINMVHLQNNNSTSQISQQNNINIGSNLIQTNVLEPIYILSNPVNEIQTAVNQMHIPQRMHQPVLTAVNATVIPQQAPQFVILNSVPNNQNLFQENLQTFTSTVSNNVPNQNLNQKNLQTFTSATSKIQNQDADNVEKIFASSMFTNMFDQQNGFRTNLSESQMFRSNTNIPTVVPYELNKITIFSLSIIPLRELVLPEPLSITPNDNQKSANEKVFNFWKLLLAKIETELEFLRTISRETIINYCLALQYKKDLTEDIWNFQLSVINVMKCVHAIRKTTNTDDQTLFDAVINTLKYPPGPQRKYVIHLFEVLRINKCLGTCGFQHSNTKKYMNPIHLELQALKDHNQLGQTTRLMSMKQKKQLNSQKEIYLQLLEMHDKQVLSLRPNCNVQNQIVNQNSSLTIRPVNVAPVTNNLANLNSLQKSSSTEQFVQKQSVLSTINVTVQKATDKSQTNNAEITINGIASGSKEADTARTLDNLNPTCLKCENPSEIVCSNCLSIAYCSRECQYNHWKEIHYKNCENYHNEIKLS